MDGLVNMSESLRDQPRNLDPIIAAASLSFGFVFIHPFMDGNGRLHRYLIHEVLSSAGFTPKGIVLPVSAVILANLETYVASLENFSGPLTARTSWNPDTPQIPPAGNDAVYFRYFDATAQTEFYAGRWSARLHTISTRRFPSCSDSTAPASSSTQISTGRRIRSMCSSASCSRTDSGSRRTSATRISRG